ncbi:MAG: anaerobic sulfatase maturase [Lentisphaerae bacterium]|nr:anaerobic sulfatase maturase [Lentisphaerota bacterium]
MPSPALFSLLIKPAGADCNLRCAYCFYLEKAALYPDTPRHRMSDAVLARLVESYLATNQPQYGFAWQGGEPTLMGSAFFSRVTELQRQHRRPGTVITNALQTNATLIDDELAAHLAADNFLVGVSLDGPAELHDAYRLTHNGHPTHASVAEGMERLRRHRVDFNILTLVNRRNAAEPERIYRHLVQQGCLHHQYIPCVAHDATGQLLPFSLEQGQWGDFLCRLFDLWYQHDTRRVSVRLFDSIVIRLIEGVTNDCTFSRDCRHYFMVEHNGDVYPCDFFAEPGLRLGNIMEHTWDELLRSPRYQAFGACKSQWNAACDTCAWLEFCAGDCPRHRYITSRDPRQRSFLCADWQQFLAHTMPRFRRLAEEIRAERQARQRGVTATSRGTSSPGRNVPCPCGSGRKFKHCCGARY